MTAFEAAADAPTVLVTAVGQAEGSRGAAAALACAGTDVDLATLLVDVGGKPPRPTLLASAAARQLEERLVAHLPQARVAARGQVCHLAVAADGEGLEAASAAVTVARGALAVLHLPPALLRACLGEGIGPKPSSALLRADLSADRALLALVVRDLMARDLTVAVLKQRLSWIAERRALFGSLAPDGTGALSSRLVKKLLSHECYIERDGARDQPTRVAQPEWRDHARTGSR
jgi:hypothetical protein